jgi:hypothetical protein
LDVCAARILPFDTSAARRHADLAVKARGAGKGFFAPDGYIAAIAATHGFAVTPQWPVAGLGRPRGLTLSLPAHEFLTRSRKLCYDSFSS